MLLASPDGQWIAIRRGRDIAMVEGVPAPTQLEAPPEPGTLTLADDDVDLAMIGPPNVLIAVSRTAVVVHQVPELEPSLPLALEVPMRLVAITGPRVALVSADGRGKHALVVRAAGRALSSQLVDLGFGAAPVGAIEFVVGLERNQLLFGLHRKLEVWDAVSARPLLRLQLQLPPPPRRVGSAQGHIWVTRPGSDEVFLYRLSDGRPFRHHAGAPIDDVISHPLSPVLVLVTARGLVRLHCFAHALALLEAPPANGALAQLVAGEDQFLIGDPTAATPWRVPIGAAAASALEPIAPESKRPGGMKLVVHDGAEPHAMPAATPAPPPVASAPVAPVPAAPAPTTAPEQKLRPELPVHRPRASARPVASDDTWRDTLAAFAGEVVAGAQIEVPGIARDVARDEPRDNELAELADRLALPAPARRALAALYGLYLIGEPALAIAHLARVVDDWTEPLGRGELAALAMLRRRNGKVALRTAVTDLLDGAAPRTIRVVGDAPVAGAPRGPIRIARDGRSDAAIEGELVTQLGRIGLIEGGAASGLLEARLHDATAVALSAPVTRPVPWPRDAGMIVVADAAAPDWVAALPALGSRAQSSSNV